jgi:hypothetical protein
MPVIDYATLITPSYGHDSIGWQIGTERQSHYVNAGVGTTGSGNPTASVSILSGAGVGDHLLPSEAPPVRRRLLALGAGRSGLGDLARRSEEILTAELGQPR